MTQTEYDQQLRSEVARWEAALRAGYSVRQMLAQTAEDGPALLRAEVAEVLSAVAQGRALPEALREWANRNPSQGLFLVVNTLLVQRETGGNLADLLQAVGVVLDKPAG